MEQINGVQYVPASESDGPYALLGNNGDKQAFYTGRAGEFWLSGTPFVYDSIDVARRKARLFNSMTAAHGYHFMAVGLVKGK